MKKFLAVIMGVILLGGVVAQPTQASERGGNKLEDGINLALEVMEE